MDAGTWASIAAVAVTLLLGWLTVRATKRSTVDAKAANDLAARDRILEARNQDIESKDRTIEARDRFIDQLQEERDRLAVRLREDREQLAAEHAVLLRQHHDALERIDMLTGQNRLLEEQAAAARRQPPML